MKTVNLIYWDGKNFGDALSPRLIEELTGLPVQYKSWDPSAIDRLKNICRKFFRFRFSGVRSILWPSQSSLIAVGSVIRWGNSKSSVWGAGFMNADDPFGGGRIYAVRGKYTSQKLEAMGFPPCTTFGDPALLLPLWIRGKERKTKQLGVIPHWKEVDAFREKFGPDTNLIDFRTADVERIVHEITDCAYILSSSLHGLIVAHAYGIPALWIKMGYIDTDGFKFDDYFSSVGIPSYQGFERLDDILVSEEGWMGLFASHWDKANCQADLDDLQRRLLAAFPLPLQPKYQALTKQLA
ncbi:polysaccharide pyruvyl transferase family protein [Sphingobacterium siyangense]|uniref:polysaccharide pyruvyl transferase family protein n=1 Tax=Sphingobacterium siyangense TaxID=459529 RepID=UPI003DA4C7AA